MDTINIPVLHDGGAARQVVTVDVLWTIRRNIAGKRFTFVVHRPHDGGFVNVLAEYRSGQKIADMSFGARYIAAGRAPDIGDIARQKLDDIIARHGEEKTRAVIESADRLN